MEGEIINYTSQLNTLISNTANLADILNHLTNVFYVLIIILGLNVCLLFKR